MKNIFTDAYFHNLGIYACFILYGMFNVYITKKFAENEKSGLLAGLATSILFPFILIFFMEPLQMLFVFDEFPEMCTIVIIINIITFFRSRRIYKIKNEIEKINVDLFNSRQITLNILQEKLSFEKEIVESGGQSKYYFDFEQIQKAIDTQSDLYEYFENVKRL